MCYDNRSDESTASKTEVKSQRERATDDADAGEAGPGLADRASDHGAARSPRAPVGASHHVGITGRRCRISAAAAPMRRYVPKRPESAAPGAGQGWGGKTGRRSVSSQRRGATAPQRTGPSSDVGDALGSAHLLRGHEMAA